MTETHSLVAEIARLNALEQHIIDRFIHRQRVARDITALLEHWRSPRGSGGVVRGQLEIHRLSHRGDFRLDVDQCRATKAVRPLSVYPSEPAAVMSGCPPSTDHHDEPEPSSGSRPSGRAARLRGEHDGR